MKRSSQEDNESMSCEICLVKFGFLKRKKQCFECRGECCSSCLIKDQGRQTCKRCRVLMAIPPNPSELMRLKVRDLKQFLSRKHVSHQGCTQKDELVNLVLQMAVNVNRQRTNLASSSATASFTFDSERASSSPPRQPHREDIQPPSSSQQQSLHSEGSIFSQGDPPISVTEMDNQSTTSSDTVQEPGKNEDTLLSLENLTNEGDINALSVRQLKLLLLRHFVDYKGCCEKAELQDRVRRLWRQNRDNEQIAPDDIPNEQLCKICWEFPINCVLLECGHMATCTECGKRMHECPICRQYVVRVVHTFRA